METIELKKLLKEIGDSVHSMNTIAVALSIMPNDNIQVPQGLDISWHPKQLDNSKITSRGFAERSAIVYAAESLFEYLDSISKNPFWIYTAINFKGEDKKASKVYKFLRQIPDVNVEMAILSELLCHWRNRIVHSNTSNAKLSSSQKDLLIKQKQKIYDNFHHFDIDIALKNYEQNKITLKDSSTLITIAIKCARFVDEYYFTGISSITDYGFFKTKLLEDSVFCKIFRQNDSNKRTRQLDTLISMNFPYIDNDNRTKILKNI
jgi:hypothetical protein